MFPEPGAKFTREFRVSELAQKIMYVDRRTIFLTQSGENLK